MLFVFLLLFASTMSFKYNENCDRLIKLRNGEVRQLLSPNHPGMEPAESTCRWTVVADRYRRVVFVCPTYHTLDISTPVGKQTCFNKFTLISEAGEETEHCQDVGFAEIAASDRMMIIYENEQNQPVDGFACYLYAELRSRWDVPENHRRQLPKPKTWQLDFSGIDVNISLRANDMINLIPPSDLGDENGPSERSWAVFAPESSRVTLVCPFTDKPPEPLTIQVVPCNGQFTVLTEVRNTTFHCSERAFSHTTNFYVPNNASIIVKYENPIGPADNFVCYIYSESDKPRKNGTIPYQNCDDILNITGLEVGIFRSPNHSVPFMPRSKCRYTVIAPVGRRILIKCIAPPDFNGSKECLGQFTFVSAGKVETIKCFKDTFSRLTRSNFITATYYYPKQPFPSIGNIPPYLCRAELHEDDYDEEECDDCGITGKFKNSHCDQIISLRHSEVRLFLSPNHPNDEPGYSTCRWTVIAPPECRIAFRCTHPTDIPLVLPCNGIITVSTDGGNQTVHCADRTFSRTSVNNRMTFVYANNNARPLKPFQCELYAEEKLPKEPLPYYHLDSTLNFIHCNYPLSIQFNGKSQLKSPNYPNKEPAGSSCRWTVIAKESRILLTCPASETQQGDSCNSTLTVRSPYLNRTYCRDVPIVRASKKGWMIVEYENHFSDPTESFACDVYSEPEAPSNECEESCTEATTLPYSECDDIFVMNNQEYKELKLPNHLEKDTPGTACRWTVISKPDSRILLSCPLNNATESSCDSKFTVLTPGSETHYCRNETIEKFSTNDWMIITYNNPSSNTYELFKCFVYTENKLPTSPNDFAPVIETLDYKSCQSHIYLNEAGQRIELTSPNRPNDITPGVPCRWTVHSLDLTFISLSCPDLSVDAEQGDELCRGYFTIYPAGPYEEPTIRCRNSPFLINSTGNQMIVTYSNQFGLSRKPFKCYVSAVDSICRHLIQLPHSPYNKFYTLFTPYWESTVPPWPSCFLTIQTPPETQIYLICGVISQWDGAMMISTTADEELADAAVHSLNTRFMEVSVSNKMTLGFNITETTKPNETIGCQIFIDKEHQVEECNCGNKFRKGVPSAASDNNRLYKGEETLPNEFTMMAAILHERKLFCGATIISHHYALTAAHCIVRAMNRNWTIELAVGAHNIPKGDYTALLINFMIEHPRYHDNYASSDYDIGIVGVESRINFNDKVGPVCLPFKNPHVGYGDKVIQLGWGFVRDVNYYDTIPYSEYIFGAPTSDVLLKTEDGDILPDLACGVSPNTMCIMYTGRDTCGGDSGGPVLWKDKDTGLLKLVGVHSAKYTSKCEADPKEKRVNKQAEVIYFLKWIQDQLPNVTFCKRE